VATIAVQDADEAKVSRKLVQKLNNWWGKHKEKS
jgi:hypothetical protein